MIQEFALSHAVAMRHSDVLAEMEQELLSAGDYSAANDALSFAMAHKLSEEQIKDEPQVDKCPHHTNKSYPHHTYSPHLHNLTTSGLPSPHLQVDRIPHHTYKFSPSPCQQARLSKPFPHNTHK